MEWCRYNINGSATHCVNMIFDSLLWAQAVDTKQERANVEEQEISQQVNAIWVTTMHAVFPEMTTSVHCSDVLKDCILFFSGLQRCYSIIKKAEHIVEERKSRVVHKTISLSLNQQSSLVSPRLKAELRWINMEWVFARFKRDKVLLCQKIKHVHRNGPSFERRLEGVPQHSTKAKQWIKKTWDWTLFLACLE